MITHRIFHMKRSGGHAVALWLAAHHKTVRHLNDVDASGEDMPDPLATGLMKTVTRLTRSREAEATIVTHEDLLPGGMPAERYPDIEQQVLIVVRDPVSVMASRIAATRNWEDFPWGPNLDLWRNFATAALLYCRTWAVVPFERFRDSPEFRRRLSARLGLEHDDLGIAAKFSSSEPLEEDFKEAEQLVDDEMRKTWQRIMSLSEIGT